MPVEVIEQTKLIFKGWTYNFFEIWSITSVHKWCARCIFVNELSVHALYAACIISAQQSMLYKFWKPWHRSLNANSRTCIEMTCVISLITFNWLFAHAITNCVHKFCIHILACEVLQIYTIVSWSNTKLTVSIYVFNIGISFMSFLLTYVGVHSAKVKNHPHLKVEK